jgi:serine/threonine protein kinase
MANIYPSRTDIVTAMRNPQVSFKASELIGGTIIQKGSRVIQYSGGYTTVFPFNTSEGEKVAVRCWIADIGDAKRRSQEISTYLANLNNPYFCNFQYLEEALLINGNIYPIVLMDWVEGKTLKDFINDNIHSNPSSISKVRENFKEMVAYFHQQNIAHGDLQHGNILVNPDSSLTIIDYDSMYIKPLEGMNDSIKGLPGYQHPSRSANGFVNPKLDYFSELVIYLSLLVFETQPNLWVKYYETEDLLFSKEDFSNVNQSALINSLLQYNNQTIVDLTNKLKEQLAKNDIQQLEPLENLLVDRLEVIKDHIFDKFDKQPNPPSKKEVKLPDVNNITNKF